MSQREQLPKKSNIDPLRRARWRREEQLTRPELVEMRDIFEAVFSVSSLGGSRDQIVLLHANESAVRRQFIPPSGPSRWCRLT